MKGNGHPTNNQNISEYVALLYQKYSHKLYCNAFHYTSNPSIAEDGVQQICEKILLHPDTALHVPEHEIIYYLFAIQRNVMYKPCPHSRSWSGSRVLWSRGRYARYPRNYFSDRKQV